MQHHNSLRKTLAAAALVALCSPAHAVTAFLDQLVVIRDGVTILNDTFEDGLPPPNTPVGFNCTSAPNCYFVTGSLSESGGKLTLNTDLGAPGSNAFGDPRLVVQARLLSNRSDAAADINFGFKQHRVFSASALYDFVVPGPGDAISIQFSDSHFDTNAPGHRTDHLLLQVRRGTTPGAGPQIRLVEQNFVAGTITTIATTALDTTLGADQIRLTLNHAVANSTEVFASWEYLQAGAVIGSGSFATPGNIFDGETWTRVDVLVSAVPEPETYAMMLIGAGLVGWRLRRKGKQSGLGRIA